MTHQPNIGKIPWSLRPLIWQPVTPETEWHDGMLVLFAVPVCLRDGKFSSLPGSRPWHYEFSFVAISVYENSQDAVSMSCEVDGESWGWDPQDADRYVVIKE